MTFDNFAIRPVNIEDAKGYLHLINSNRDRIEKYFPKTARTVTNTQNAVSHLIERVAQSERKEFILFLITETTTENIVGIVFLKDINWNIPKAELGFFVDRNYEGKGITTRSLFVVIEYPFKTLKLNKLFMRIGKENLSSQRVAEKNGFLLEGVLRNDFKAFDGSLVDMNYYGLLRTD